MWRGLLIAAQLVATVLFIWNFESAAGDAPLAWAPPAILILLVVVNAVRFTRFVSWTIFSVAFFAFLVILSAFTLRWRLEPGFDSWPFYRAIGMYVAFIYISLAQIKLLGQPPDRADARASTSPEDNRP